MGVTQIQAADVKALRDATGAGMMDCKNALLASDGDMDRARTWLREKGLSRAASKAGRSTKEGLIESYVHGVGGAARVGVLVELNCESDFVARTDTFRELAREIALQVAGTSPLYVHRDEVPKKLVDAELAIFTKQIEGRPPEVAEKILAGKLDSYYSSVCLLDQPYIREPKRKVRDLVSEAIAKVGENITVNRFVRFQVGETQEAGDESTDV